MSSLIYIQKWIRDVSILHSSDIIVCVCLQVEEVKKHNHCLAFSSAGPQSQTYYVSFDSFTEHLRWQRHAAKVLCGQKSSQKEKEEHMLPGHYFWVSCTVRYNTLNCTTPTTMPLSYEPGEVKTAHISLLCSLYSITCLGALTHINTTDGSLLSLI